MLPFAEILLRFVTCELKVDELDPELASSNARETAAVPFPTTGLLKFVWIKKGSGLLPAAIMPPHAYAPTKTLESGGSIIISGAGIKSTAFIVELSPAETSEMRIAAL